jgi:mono/diheme cytochrome c family protein
MAVLVFVLFWVVVALALVFLAFRGGPQAARARRQAMSRRGNGVVILGFVIALLVLGVVIPLSVFRGEKDRDSFPEAGVTQLTSVEKHGQEVFGMSCRQCHTLKASGAAGVIGPNLDQLKPPKALVLDAVHNGRARGNGNMAADLVVGEDAQAVAQYVAVATGGEQPQ